MIYPLFLHSEFNHVKNADGKCVLVAGTSPLPSDDSCRGNDEYWYERTAYRKVPYSSCEGGFRPDQGTRHLCPGLRGRGALFWLTILFFPFAMTALVAWWWYKKSGLARGWVSFILRFSSPILTFSISASIIELSGCRVQITIRARWVDSTGLDRTCSIRSRLFRGSCLDWRVLRTSMWRLMWKGFSLV